MSAHPFTHVELSSSDRGASKAFYGPTLGWSFQDDDEMDYTIWSAGEGNLSGGLNPVSDQNPAGTVMIYLYTDSLIDTIGMAAGNGGTVLMESMEIPTVGRMGVVQDPSGNVISVMQPAPQS